MGMYDEMTPDWVKNGINSLTTDKIAAKKAADARAALLASGAKFAASSAQAAIPTPALPVAPAAQGLNQSVSGAFKQAASKLPSIADIGGSAGGLSGKVFNGAFNASQGPVMGKVTGAINGLQSIGDAAGTYQSVQDGNIIGAGLGSVNTVRHAAGMVPGPVGAAVRGANMIGDTVGEIANFALPQSVKTSIGSGISSLDGSVSSQDRSNMNSEVYKDTLKGGKAGLPMSQVDLSLYKTKQAIESRLAENAAADEAKPYDYASRKPGDQASINAANGRPYRDTNGKLVKPGAQADQIVNQVTPQQSVSPFGDTNFGTGKSYNPAMPNGAPSAPEIDTDKYTNQINSLLAGLDNSAGGSTGEQVMRSLRNKALLAKAQGISTIAGGDVKNKTEVGNLSINQQNANTSVGNMLNGQYGNETSRLNAINQMNYHNGMLDINKREQGIKDEEATARRPLLGQLAAAKLASEQSIPGLNEAKAAHQLRDRPAGDQSSRVKAYGLASTHIDVVSGKKTVEQKGEEIFSSMQGAGKKGINSTPTGAGTQVMPDAPPVGMDNVASEAYKRAKAAGPEKLAEFYKWHDSYKSNK